MNTSTVEDRFWENYAKWKENPNAFYVSRSVLLLDWKSQKHRGMERYKNKLSPSMLNALHCLLLDKKRKPKSTTLSALQKRQLVNTEGELTDYGLVIALKPLPLEQQCKFLNLPFEEWEFIRESKPEESVRRIFEERGSKAYFVENTFGLFIDYLLGDATIAVATKLGKKVYTLNPPYDLELFFWIKRDLAEYLASFDIDHCQTNFAVCSPFLQKIIMDETPSQIVNLFDDIYRALGVEKVKSLIRMYFANPLAYNYRGWPDLFVIENDSTYFVEVKTTDRLHLNQLVTISDLTQYTEIPVRVVRLKGDKV
jgi:hypothetical protein